jgi:hypothetical protein
LVNELSSRAVSLQPHFPDDDAEFIDDVRSMLSAWGTETGAVDQSLDRRLRLSSALRNKVLNELEPLVTSLRKGEFV